MKLHIPKPTRSTFHKVVNYFLFFVIGLFVIVIMFLGFTQTTTFREILREQTLAALNDSINGRFSIEKIDGTFFTTLTVRGAALTQNTDTIFSVKRIEVKFSPWSIFKRKILVNKIALTDIFVHLESDSSGIYNIEKVFPAGETDTSASEFPFVIQVNEIILRNMNFRMNSYDRRTTEILDALDINNFSVENFNLTASAEADINNNDYTLNIDSLTFSPNISYISSCFLSAAFHITRDGFDIPSLRITTDNTDVTIGVSAKKFHLFENFSPAALDTCEFSFSLDSPSFDFEDLNRFVPTSGILSGKIRANASFKGNLKDLVVDKFDIYTGQSKLLLKGSLNDILEGSSMKIDAVLTDSRLETADVRGILPFLRFPELHEYKRLIIDSLSYTGTPLSFRSKSKLRTGEGVLRGDISLDFTGTRMNYKCLVDCFNLNFSSFTGRPVVFNGSISADGEGVDIASLKMNFDIDGAYSVIGYNVMRELLMSGTVENGIIDSRLKAASKTDSLFLQAKIDFSDREFPSFTLFCDSYGLNLQNYLADSTLFTDLNVNIWASGKGIDPETLSGEISLQVDNTRFTDKNIKSLSAYCVVENAGESGKSISLKSDIVDFSMKGNYRILQLGKVFSTEIYNLWESLAERINQYAPGDTLLPYPTVSDTTALKVDTTISDYNFDYKLIVKDLKKIGLFDDEQEAELEGTLTGKVINDNKQFSLIADIDLGFLKYFDSHNAFFVRDLTFKFALSHPKSNYRLEALKSSLESNAARVFFESDIKNARLDYFLSNGILTLNGGSQINDKIAWSVSAKTAFLKDSLNTSIDNIMMRYNLYEVKNKDEISLKFAGEKLSITNLNLQRGYTTLRMNGTLSREGKQDVNIDVKNLKGYDISYSLLGIPPEEIIDNDINIRGKLEGTLNNPKINLTASVENISYNKTIFGSLFCKLDYFAKKLNMDVQFRDTLQLRQDVNFFIKGFIPIDLSFGNVTERLPQNDPVDLQIRSNGFDLAAFGDALPFVNQLRGILNANIDITGTYEKLNRQGTLSVSGVSFVVEKNNLAYSASGSLRLENEFIFVDTVIVQNSGKVKNKGTVTGSGKIEFSGLELRTMRLYFKGDLTVLSNDSRSASPAVYGDLFVGSDGEISFVRNRDKSFLYVPVLVKEANLVFPPTQSGYSAGTADNFVYKYIEEKKEISEREKEIQRMLEFSDARKSRVSRESSAQLNLDYEIRIGIKDEALITFIFAQEANQKLLAALKGDILLEQRNGIKNIQGELKVLEGSTLEFLKTFTATGSLRFESELTNPYLDITGLYKGYYIPTDTTQSVNPVEEEVAVKVKLKGPLSDLSKSFSQLENNIAVYYGKDNIEKDVVSTEYDKADAIWFVLLGKFKKDLTQQDRTKASGQIDLVTGTATSLAGTLLGGLLNTYLGDVVKTLEFRSVGSATKFNLSGRYKNLKYTIGGSTNFLQDFSTANIRIEYPVIENFIIRLERRESTTDVNYTNEMINELGLRYRFEF